MAMFEALIKALCENLSEKQIFWDEKCVGYRSKWAETLLLYKWIIVLVTTFHYINGPHGFHVERVGTRLIRTQMRQIGVE